jgi:hypothetical protein
MTALDGSRHVPPGLSPFQIGVPRKGTILLPGAIWSTLNSQQQSLSSQFAAGGKLVYDRLGNRVAPNNSPNLASIERKFKSAQIYADSDNLTGSA